MASRSIGGSSSFDVPVAALAGLSVAFAVFAAPADLLAELIGATPLPSLLPAAEPPLGLDARIAIGAAGAVAMFAFAFLLLRWLDRFGRRRAETAEAAEDAAIDMEMPRLRRRDFHPDAAPRPPLFAGAELGEPELELSSEAEAAASQTEPEAVDPPPPEPPQYLRRAWLPGSTAQEAAPQPTAGPAIEPAAPEPPQRGNSIGELLERLELGLARRRMPAPVAPAAAAVEPVEREVFPPATDDRLQSAIDSLQRLASRHD